MTELDHGNLASEINRVLVIGAGAMGSQIAMLCALAGIRTTLQDISREALDLAETQLRDRLGAQVERGRRSAAEVAEAFAKLNFSTDLEASAATIDYAIEAATERLDVKQGIFARLGATAPEHAILATNSSTLGSSRVAAASGRPDRVCNLHFFNPALVMRAVEVVRGPHTSDATIDATLALAQRLGKEPVLLEKEIPGFVANRLMGAVRTEAIQLYADGVASIADIDTAAKGALGYPMGPFELMDLVGLDVTVLIREATHQETGDPADLPHPLLLEHVRHGRLGRKSGKGWYDYDKQ